jgi:hypothetical protein
MVRVALVAGGALEVAADVAPVVADPEVAPPDVSDDVPLAALDSADVAPAGLEGALDAALVWGLVAAVACWVVDVVEEPAEQPDTASATIDAAAATSTALDRTALMTGVLPAGVVPQLLPADHAC